MFYRTQIKSVGSGYAVDVFGKHLYFIGYYPCKAGDIVWTDGRVIFGNISVKPTPITFNESAGVPVLADNLRGYFTKNASFKEYGVVQADWIVNDNSHFFHGDSNGIIDTENSDEDESSTTISTVVIDAEVSTDGELLTAVSIVVDNFATGVIEIKKGNKTIDTFDLDSYKGKEKDTVWLKFFRLDRNGGWTAGVSVVSTEYDEYAAPPSIYSDINGNPFEVYNGGSITVTKISTKEFLTNPSREQRTYYQKNYVSAGGEYVIYYDLPLLPPGVIPPDGHVDKMPVRGWLGPREETSEETYTPVEIPIQDGFYYTFDGVGTKLFAPSNDPRFDNPLILELDYALSFHSIVKLSGNLYLARTFSGLYKISNGKISYFEDSHGLKNFRLRTLKNISKARR